MSITYPLLIKKPIIPIRWDKKASSSFLHIYKECLNKKRPIDIESKFEYKITSLTKNKLKIKSYSIYD